MAKSEDTKAGKQGDTDPFEGIQDLAPPTPPPPENALDPTKVERAPAPTTAPAMPPPPPKPSKAKTSAAPPAEEPPAKPRTMLARIKPFNKRRGNVTRNYTVFGIRFKEGQGWYRVTQKVGEYLEKLTADGDPDGPEIFDVVDSEEAAQQIEARDRRRAMEREERVVSTPEDPRETNARDDDEAEGVLTTRDLPTRSSGRGSMRTSRRE